MIRARQRRRSTGRPSGAERPAPALAAVALAVLLAAAAACSPDSAGRDGRAQTRAAGPTPPGGELAGGSPATLAPTVGASLERRLADDEEHVYELALEAGRYVRIAVDQRGVDLVVRWRPPGDGGEIEVDGPIDDRGTEVLEAVAVEPGPHSLALRAWSGGAADGRYRITVEASRPASEHDLRRAEAAARFAAAERASWSGDREAAETGYRDTLRRWRDLGDPSGRAEVHDRLCRLDHERRDWAGMHVSCRTAAHLFHLLGETRREAMSLRHLGVARFHVGDGEAAVELYGRALELAEAVGDRRGIARILDHRAVAFQVLDETQRALDDYARAVPAWRASGNRVGLARTLQNSGVLYRLAGRPALARDRLEQAAAIWGELGDEGEVATSLNQLGQLAQDSGDPAAAEELYDRALDIRRRIGDRHGIAKTLEKQGRLALERGHVAAARARFGEALAHLGDGQDPRRHASLGLALGTLERTAGRPRAALAALRPALAAYRRVGDLSAQAECLLETARAERARGRLEAAREAVEESLGLVESVRVATLREDLRSSFFATVEDHFDTAVAVLIDLERARPGEGYAERAFEIAERGRARSLLDGLAENGAGIRADAEPSLLAEERRLREAVATVDRRRIRFAEAGPELADAVAASERELHRRLAELESVRARIRAESPRYAALSRPRPVSLPVLQRELLDPGLRLLAYRLGSERSVAWLVGRESIATFDLPPRATIEAATRRAHELLRRSHRRAARTAAREALCALSDLVLGPLASQLATQRLAIVPDGALAYVPFAALPAPVDPETARPAPAGCVARSALVASHEIVYWPSASAVAELRRRAAARPEARGTVAVVADPVLRHDDPRVDRPPGRGEPERRRAPAVSAAAGGGAVDAERSVQAGELARLVFARQEAETIVSLAGRDRSVAILGFEASKETVLSGRLRGFRLLHFATHGVLDSRFPALSGLVLSALDEHGAARDPYLRAHELYSLDLPADLVVLSACETALGAEMRGEGIVGLARGLLHAGAGSVAVSLWRVSDRSTAELMERFYRALLLDGERPAAALRSAQLALRREPRTAAPYHWAGFVLQGDQPSRAYTSRGHRDLERPAAAYSGRRRGEMR